MKIGTDIKAARRKRGWTLEKLGGELGLSISTLSGYENDNSKGGPDPETLCRIADNLDDLSILVNHCQACPVRNHVFLKQFPDLNNIRRDPAIIANRLRKEMLEAAAALDSLAERFSSIDFQNRPDYAENFTREMEQVIDAKRNIEILEFELMMSGVHTSVDLQKVYDRQQKKCEARGYHQPKEAKV